jgi:NAD(P)-dependent dehydrogenase (short-subunit alcohol dehydrogenase family)
MEANMATGKLEDKVVIITGGNSGIGKASSLLFASEGAKVVIAARNQTSGENVVQSIKASGVGEAIFVKTDVANPEEIEQLIEVTQKQFGRVDILYGNAGLLVPGTAPETSIETWRKVIDINLSGQFYLMKYGIPALIKSGGKSIILTSSELGTVGTTATVAYCAAKGGLINMVRALAIDCAPHGIRVNCLAPGPIDTPMLRDWFSESDDPKSLEDAQTKPVLLGRLGTPEEIAEAALFLATDSSSFMTGALLIADGGCTAWYGL